MLTDLFFTNVAYASLDSFIAHVNKIIINPLLIFLFSLALFYFLYGMFDFIANQENEEKKEAGKSHMLWGIVGIVIMLGVFTILNIIMKTFNIEGVNPKEGTVELPDYTPPLKEHFLNN